MNNELKIMLEAVMKEALQPIQEELQGLNQRVGGIENEVKGLNQRIDGLENKVESIGIELKDFRDETKTTLQVIQTSQHGTREELTQRFKEVNHNIERLQTDVVFTYQKTALHELELNRIKSQ